MDFDAQRSAWLSGLESDWRRELAAQRASIEELWHTALAERLSNDDALRVTNLRFPSERRLLVTPENSDLCRMREGDFLCLSQDRPFAPTGKFIHLGEDEEGIHLHCWRGQLPEPGTTDWILDRDFVDLSDRYEQATRALAETERGREKILPFLQGDSGGAIDGELFSETMDDLEDPDTPQDVLWHDSQQDAIAACIATHDGYLVQGPPGTGKTFVLSEVVCRLMERGERILVTGPTHRAIRHALEGCRKLLPPTIRTVKIGPALAETGTIEAFETLAESGLLDEPGPYVLGATPFALWSDFTGLKEAEFDTVVIDEASQVTLMVAIMAMLRGDRWLFFGDDCQLPPVALSGTAESATESSVFRRLKDRGFDAMLEETWRLNEQLAAWPSATFYGNRLSCRTNRQFQLEPPSAHPALVPDYSATAFIVEGTRTTVRSEAEAQAAADIIRELIRGGTAPEEIGVITPYRSQAAAIRSILRISAATTGLHRLVTVDTVERFQGQERDVILVSLASAKPEWIRRLAPFLFQPERWNVAITRARRKLIVVASSGLLAEAEALASAGDPAATCFSSWIKDIALAKALIHDLK